MLFMLIYLWRHLLAVQPTAQKSVNKKLKKIEINELIFKTLTYLSLEPTDCTPL